MQSQKEYFHTQGDRDELTEASWQKNTAVLYYSLFLTLPRLAPLSILTFIHSNVKRLQKWSGRNAPLQNRRWKDKQIKTIQ